MEESKDAQQDSARARRRLTVAIAGGGLRAAAMLRLLLEVDSITVAALAEPRSGAAAAVAERIRSEVENLSFASIGVNPSVRKTISVGVATFPAHAHAGASLIIAADQAMYAAKRSGKNAVVVAG